MGLILSKEYGVNPSVEVCVICGEEMGVVMFGNSYKENGKPAEAPHKICMGSLCPTCQKAMGADGIFFIEVQDGESGKEHPQRTGRFCCVKESAVKKNVQRLRTHKLHGAKYVFQLLFPHLS